jgi:hypothetical protein
MFVHTSEHTASTVSMSTFVCKFYAAQFPDNLLEIQKCLDQVNTDGIFRRYQCNGWYS